MTGSKERRALDAVRVVTWRSPWGPLPVQLHRGRVHSIGLDPRAELPPVSNPPDGRPAGPLRTSADVTKFMGRVMTGKLTARAALAASDLSGYTEFERSVFAALAKVKRGETITYGEIATSVGAPRAARAVGTALGKNRAPILLPCHRVVASSGIGGYGGSAARAWRPGGQDPIAFKRALLASEGVSAR